MNKKVNELIILAIQRAIELSNVASNNHLELEKWRPEKLNDNDREKLSKQLDSALIQQRNWLSAIDTYLEEEDE